MRDERDESPPRFPHSRGQEALAGTTLTQGTNVSLGLTPHHRFLLSVPLPFGLKFFCPATPSWPCLPGLEIPQPLNVDNSVAVT